MSAPARAPRKLRKTHRDGQLRAVVDETIALFHRLAWVADRSYGDTGRGTARRGLLRGLVRYGPGTVPALARTRRVKRQSLQPVVDALVQDGLVELVPNPAHATSRLVRVTAAGRRLVERLDRVDARVLSAVGPGLDAAELERAARTLRRVRERFEATVLWRDAAEGA